jgi:hypothetical protein
VGDAVPRSPYRSVVRQLIEPGVFKGLAKEVGHWILGGAGAKAVNLGLEGLNGIDVCHQTLSRALSVEEAGRRSAQGTGVPSGVVGIYGHRYHVRTLSWLVSLLFP